MKKNCHFVDGVQRNALHPGTYEIPSEADKREIEPGDFVKICVSFTDPSMPRVGGEGFWMRVGAISDGTVTGMVTNFLIFTDQHGVSQNDTLTVELRHIP